MEQSNDTEAVPGLNPERVLWHEPKFTERPQPILRRACERFTARNGRAPTVLLVPQDVFETVKAWPSEMLGGISHVIVDPYVQSNHFALTVVADSDPVVADAPKVEPVVVGSDLSAYEPPITV